jgi:hypothetical protein
MVGLHYLKHAFDLSVEATVERFVGFDDTSLARAAA